MAQIWRRRATFRLDLPEGIKSLTFGKMFHAIVRFADHAVAEVIGNYVRCLFVALDVGTFQLRLPRSLSH